MTKLLEVKGVSWSFSPLEVPRGSTALRFLGDAADFRDLTVSVKTETVAMAP